MSHLAPHFDPDVFVSYSHGDPIADRRAPLREWTQALVQRLEEGLHALETEFDDLDLWMDRKIDPTAHLTDELKRKVGKCGILVIVMSKRYLNSKWCKEEREWFKAQIKERPGTDGRVFVIRAQKTDTKQWPDFLRDEGGNAMPGFPFYDPENGYPWGFRQSPNDEYFKELDRLQRWLITRLRELGERAAKRAGAEKSGAALPKPAGSRRIYLHAPYGSKSVLAEVSLALKGDGIVPLTAHTGAGGQLADWQREARDRIETAKRCDALALLRIENDEQFVGDILDIGVDERERIVGTRGAQLPCAVLDKTGEALPIDVAPFGIERFDVNRTDWPGQFRAWLDASRGVSAGAAA